MGVANEIVVCGRRGPRWRWRTSVSTCVTPILGDFYLAISGGYHVTSAAFGSSRQPSVDRAFLCNHDPETSQRRPNECIVSFTAGEVRNIKGFGQSVDVVPDPNPPENPSNSAHALIVVDPPLSTNQFRRFKQRLAGIADSRWEIAPPDHT